MKTVTPHLVLFARYPTAGTCKTRLIPAVGAETAANVHRLLAERTVRLLQGSGAPVTVATTGAEACDFEAWLGVGVDLQEQVEGDLTERLLAFAGRSPIIFFGADTPDLSETHISQAIEGLISHEVVIGPAHDGGYYLIGMRNAHPELFTDMPWSTDQVLPETLKRLDALGIEPLLLDPLSDCDRPEDLSRWPHLVEDAQPIFAQSIGK